MSLRDAATGAMVDELAAVLPPDRVSAGESDRRLHGEDLSQHPAAWPDVVVFATSTEEVAATLRWAHERRVPVVPFGAGTSLEGHITAVRGGVSLDLTRMDAIVEVRPEDLTVTAQAGVTRLRLERHLGERGLQLPVDPGADATLGGMAATNAAGTMTLRHGKMRSRVLALEAVLPGGRVIRTGSHALKTSAGYDLTGLLVGSEGTLGVITELTLRLEPIPDRTQLVQASFPSMALACGAVQALVALGPEVRRIELMDPWEISAMNAFAGRSLPELPLLLIELGGSEEAVAATAGDVLDALLEHDAEPIVEERDPTAQRRMWRLRHDAYFAEQAIAPGRATVSTDVCVPLSALAATMDATRAAMDRLGLLGGIVSHAGDGNVHAGLLVDTTDAGEMERLARFVDTIVGDALAVGGTCSGEHGIGVGKRTSLAREHGDSLDLMAAIKEVFDPHGIMNPGKVLPDGAQGMPGA
jgi:D-lactate dehydrogenase (cytochrome)